MATRKPSILPDATLGILGGGQLGRMTATAARAMGFRVHVLDPDANCPARYVVERCVTAGFDDAEAALDLARGCSVVTGPMPSAVSGAPCSSTPGMRARGGTWHR